MTTTESAATEEMLTRYLVTNHERKAAGQKLLSIPAFLSGIGERPPNAASAMWERIQKLVGAGRVEQVKGEDGRWAFTWKGGQA